MVLPNRPQQDEKEQKRLLMQRQALLAQVDALEEYLDMPRTSDMRRWAKDHGYRGIIAESDK